MTITLRPHQIAAADAVEDAWRAGVARPLVDACVGSGKSLIMAELARRSISRGERVIIGAHTRELVEQNANACRLLMPGVHVGMNAAALNERTWRAPIISAAIQSIYKNAASFGPIGAFLGDEAHLWPHAESGMYRGLVRDLGNVRVAGLSGTVFRLQGGSLVEGEGAPFDKVVFRYSILDGISDEFLCPAFTAETTEVVDPTKLRVRQGEYTADSQDAQMIEAMDSHIVQMIHAGVTRQGWLVFEASTKAAKLMCARLNQFGIPTGIVLGETPAAERSATIAAFRAKRLRCLVNVMALTTGFDVPHVDMLVMRFKTKSLVKYIQVLGRLLRVIGGNFKASVAAGKKDGILLDYGGNVDDHGPLYFLTPKDTKARLVSCDICQKRNAAAAARCWSCDAPMTKNCPACLTAIQKGTLDCPACNFDMRQAERTASEGAKLFDVPSGAALIATYKTGAERAGGWLPVVRAWEHGDGHAIVQTGIGADQARHELRGPLAGHAKAARWLRCVEGAVAILVPNGASRTVARQINADGSEIIVPLPAVVSEQVDAA